LGGCEKLRLGGSVRYLVESDPKHVYTIDTGTEIWAGPISQWAASAPELVVDLTGKEPIAKAVVAPEFPELEIAPKVIRVNWPDMGVIWLPREWWVRLAEALKGFRRVYIGCGAGIGRTGTALSILAHLYGVVPSPKGPIAWVREVYNGGAVETPQQRQYVAKITGVEEDLPEWGLQRTLGDLLKKAGARTNHSSFRSKEEAAEEAAALTPDRPTRGVERIYEALESLLDNLEYINFTVEGDTFMLEGVPGRYLTIREEGPLWRLEGVGVSPTLLPSEQAFKRVEEWVWEAEAEAASRYAPGD
jgi:hypothetical protein